MGISFTGVEPIVSQPRLLDGQVSTDENDNTP
jgi:hypothetical protein